MNGWKTDTGQMMLTSEPEAILGMIARVGAVSALGIDHDQSQSSSRDLIMVGPS